MLDKGYIGKTYPSFVLPVEMGRIRFFAEAIGDDNPVYRDEVAARAAGFRSIPAPPTFALSLLMDSRRFFGVVQDLGLPPERALHGEQWFTHYAPIYAGDVLTGQYKIVDLYDKKDGALDFIVTESTLKNQNGDRVCAMKVVLVVRN